MSATPASVLPQSLLEQYTSVRQATERLAAPLSAEDQMVQSTSEASPTKWHLAHTTWYFETFVLLPYARGFKPFDARFTHLFNSYYKQLDAGHPVRTIRGHFSRPSLAEVCRYRQHTDAAMASLLSESGLAPDAVAIIEIGIHHEQQHQELILTDIKHAFWVNPLRPAYRAPSEVTAQSAPAQQWVEFEGGKCNIGHDGTGFAYDNESPRYPVLLNPFRLGSRLVTCGEYLAFMEDGGYRRPELWLSDGWDQVCLNQWQAPLYWERADVQWAMFALSGTRPVESNEPVCHVSYYEADAFARWAGARLPLEAEWEVAAAARPISGNFLESERLHPVAASNHAPLAQLYGDVWEWTASPYTPYPGFRPAAGVLGEYNGKFMCNQLVLRGGSCATPQSHIRATYRNFFPPQARWQFMGIRLANDCS